MIFYFILSFRNNISPRKVTQSMNQEIPRTENVYFMYNQIYVPFNIVYLSSTEITTMANKIK